MKLQVNERGLITNLKAIFSSNSKVISELLQNCRRAGANIVDIQAKETGDGLAVTISDDGCGIGDFQKLFTIAESGWGNDVVSNENPYGMGALAMLFIAKAITISSNGQTITVTSDAALRGETIDEPIKCSEAPSAGTSICLEGIDISIDQLEKWVQESAEAFSIPVFFNGEAIARPYCIEELKAKNTNVRVYDTPYGQLVLLSRVDWLSIFVQEGLVSGDPRPGTGALLFSTNQLQARMPDRDKLINESEVLEEVRSYVKQIVSDELHALRTEMADDTTFIKKHFDEVINFCPEMLSSISLLPSAAFEDVEEPDLSGAKFYYYRQPNCLIIKPDTDRMIINESFDSESIMANYFAYAVGALRIKSSYARDLPADHWIFKKVTKDIGNHQYSVIGSIEKNTHIQLPHSSTLYSVKAAIGSFELLNESLNKRVEVKEGIFIGGDHYDVPPVAGIGDVELYIDKHWSDLECILRQSCSYMDEFDAIDETSIEEDKVSFERQVQLAMTDDITDYVSEVLKLYMSKHAIESISDKGLKIQVVDGNLSVSNLAA